MIEQAGLELLHIGPLLYTAGGIFHETFEAFKDTAEGRARLKQLEKECETDPVYAPLGRVWTIVARRPAG